ncbi:MAG: hypothetical protein ACYC8T_11290 [Myxococcaceae bacterium]
MRRVLISLIALGSLALTACGDPARSRAPTASQALSSTAEVLEFETVGTRQELFRDIARLSLSQEGRPANGAVLFPIVQDGQVIAAPGFESRADLFQAPDAGEPLQLSFDGRGERWSEDRRDSLQGLSEREAVELVARTLLNHWGIHPSGTIQVGRVSGTPYAAAYMDGMLRVNPAFVYLAASALVPPGPAGVSER